MGKFSFSSPATFCFWICFSLYQNQKGFACWSRTPETRGQGEPVGRWNLRCYRCRSPSCFLPGSLEQTPLPAFLFSSESFAPSLSCGALNFGGIFAFVPLKEQGLAGSFHKPFPSIGRWQVANDQDEELGQLGPHASSPGARPIFPVLRPISISTAHCGPLTVPSRLPRTGTR